jgi:hypothetical protein
MVPRRKHHHQYVQCERQKEQGSVDDSEKENTEAAQRG